MKTNEIQKPIALSHLDETWEEMYVNMGPQHPSTHGVLRLVLKMDGEVVTECVPHIGYLHRCQEKISENRTYTQCIPYTDRLDYLSSMSNNIAFCLAVERLMGVQLPERAEFIRVIMAELQRIASHLVWVGTYGLDLGNVTIFMYCMREREIIVDLFEEASGQRLNYNFFRIGGSYDDLPPGFVDKAKEFLPYFKKRLQDYDKILTYNMIWQKRLQGVGFLPKAKAIAYGVSGPMLRGSGVKWDLRRNVPYSIYERLEFDIPVGSEKGDCWDRYLVRMEEMRQSVRILEQALAQIPEGDFMAKVPKVPRPPVGDVFNSIENPRGELGFYIISDGSTKPYRVKTKAPCFINLQALPEMAVGSLIADVVAILGSVDIVLGEVDK